MVRSGTEENNRGDHQGATSLCFASVGAGSSSAPWRATACKWMLHCQQRTDKCSGVGSCRARFVRSLTRVPLCWHVRRSTSTNVRISRRSRCDCTWCEDGKHGKQLCPHWGPRYLQMLARSAIGLVDVYNLLPQHVVEQKSVAAMQHELQMLLKFRALNGDDWLASHLLAACPSTRGSVASFFLTL